MPIHRFFGDLRPGTLDPGTLGSWDLGPWDLGPSVIFWSFGFLASSMVPGFPGLLRSIGHAKKKTGTSLELHSSKFGEKRYFMDSVFCF